MCPRKLGDICPKVSRNLMSIEVLVQNPKNYLIFHICLKNEKKSHIECFQEG